MGLTGFFSFLGATWDTSSKGHQISVDRATSRGESHLEDGSQEDRDSCQDEDDGARHPLFPGEKSTYLGALGDAPETSEGSSVKMPHSRL